MAKDPFQHLAANDPFAVADRLFEKMDLSESPIEEKFWSTHLALDLPHLRGMVQQHSPGFGSIRLDYALPQYRLAIELDGFEYHRTKDSFIKDRKRDRELSMNLWAVLHFSGTEIYIMPRACVQQANVWAGIWIRERT